MLFKTLLNRVDKHKSFVYDEVRLVEKGKCHIEVTVRPRKHAKPLCSGCGQAGPGYDCLPARRFDYVPLWSIAVILIYAMRRVNCPRCGVKVEQVPWATGKSPLTGAYAWFLAVWARRLSWQEVARAFDTTWDRVYDAVSWTVSYGLAHQDRSGITALGVDEIVYGKGQNRYLTLVYQINQGCRRLLWIGEQRTQATLHRFFDWLGEVPTASIQFVCSDMWQPYLTVIAKRATQALHILDRFHIMAHLNKAIDEVRREEARKLRRQGERPLLKNARWCLLKRVRNLTQKQRGRLKELLALNLRSIRAYLLKEDFHHFWDYKSPTWAGKFLDQWTTRVLRSKIEPMKKVARTLREHRPLILNWFRAKGKVSNGVVEGLNNKAKTTIKKSYGFRRVEVLKVALYHTLGELPLPPVTHKFC
jgi:transposase